MLSIRIVIAGAVLGMAVLGMAVGGAAAQTTADPGKPIQLLHVGQPNKAKTHAKVAKRPTATKHHALAAGQSKHRPASRAAAAGPAKVWPALEPVPTASVAAAEPAPASDHPAPSELVVGGQTVQVAAPSDVNALDLAAGTHADAAVTASKSDAGAMASNSDAGGTATSDAAPAQPEAHAMMAAPEQQDASPVGSTTWIAKVLAALGGAIAAGSVAWFLIGSTPQRTYG